MPDLDQTAPEAHNLAQDDSGEQAQTLADEALGREPLIAAGESEKAPGPEGSEGTLPDLVDTMGQMVSSGRIDMSAYRGERMDDDEEAALGPQGLEDDWPRGAE